MFDLPVPQYLPALPRDALAAGSPVRYDRDRGVAWTVGKDAADHGGRSRDDLLRANPDLPDRAAAAAGHDEVARLRP